MRSIGKGKSMSDVEKQMDETPKAITAKSCELLHPLRRALLRRVPLLLDGLKVATAPL